MEGGLRNNDNQCAISGGTDLDFILNLRGISYENAVFLFQNFGKEISWTTPTWKIKKAA
jgi:hypothetical protein